MTDRNAYTGTGPSGLVHRMVTAWALLGGILLLVLVAMNSYSIIGNQFGKPFPGDFEMTEIGVAIAAFSFLPYCQLTGANVTADVFTSRASPFTLAILAAVYSLVAIGFALLLMWRMYAGMIDQKNYDYSTAILDFPIWLGFVPILISLALLAPSSLVTLRDAVHAMRG